MKLQFEFYLLNWIRNVFEIISKITNMSYILAFLVLGILLVLLQISTIHAVRTGSSDEYRLLQDLFERKDGGYNPRIRPVENISDIISTGFEMALIQLINLDERNQIMKTNVWLRLYWCDYQLRWNTKEYGNIDVIRIQPDRVWKPDIVLYNNADGRFQVSFEANVLVYSNGYVMWIPCTIYKSSCSIDVTYFPFDEQECELSFASWTYDSSEVTMKWYLTTTDGVAYTHVDLSDYEKSGSWDLVDFPGEITEKDNRTFINYKVKLRRKTLYYTVNLIIPCLLISILTTAVFMLPADAGEKTTMSVSILLALVVFLQVLVTNLLPPSSTSFPLFAKYLLFAVVLDVIAVVNTIFVLNWHYKTPRTHKMPKIIRSVFLDFLPKILFVQRPSSNDQQSSERKSFHPFASCAANPSPPVPTPESTRRPALKPLEIDFSEVHNPNCPVRKRLLKQQQQQQRQKRQRQHKDGDDEKRDMETIVNDEEEEVKMVKLEPEIIKAVEAVRFISAHLKNGDDYLEVIDDWRYIAQVIDRLLLYIYLVVTIASTLIILINAPNIYENIDQDAIKKYYHEFHSRLTRITANTIAICPYG